MAHYLLTIPFGKGIVNNIIAKKVKEQQIFLSLKFMDPIIFTQKQMQKPLEKVFYRALITPKIRYADQSGGRYISTAKLIQQLARLLREGDTVYIITAIPLQERVMRDMKETLLDIGLYQKVDVPLVKFIQEEIPVTWFRTLNRDVWTRYKAVWNMRERIISRIPREIYKNW